MTLSHDGATEEMLLPSANAFEIAIGPDTIYWVDYEKDDTLVSLPRTTTGKSQPVVPQRTTFGVGVGVGVGAGRGIAALAVDRCNVYWSHFEGHDRLRAKSH